MMGYRQESAFEIKDGILYITDEENEITEVEYKLEGNTLTLDDIEYTKK